MEQSVILIKPDTIERNLLPELENMLREAGLKIVKISSIQLTEEIVRSFQPFLNYSQEIEEIHKQEIIDFLCQASILLIVIEGNEALERIREIKIRFRRKFAPGDSLEARAIRNLVHAPNSEEELSLLLKVFSQVI